MEEKLFFPVHTHSSYICIPAILILKNIGLVARELKMAEVGNDCYFFFNSICIKVNIVQFTVLHMLKLFSRMKEDMAIICIAESKFTILPQNTLCI